MDIEFEERNGGRTVRLAPRGDVTVATAGQLYDQIEAAAGRTGLESLVLDFGQVARLDSAGIAVVSLARERMADRGVTLRTESVSDEHRETLGLMPPAAAETPDLHVPTAMEAMGEFGLAGWREVDRFYETLTDAAFALVGMLRGKLAPKGSFTEQAVATGVNAFPIVGLLSLLLGLIMAFQSAYQLRQFGANIYVANLVGISMVREFGPMMTGIMLAGRSGSSIAAELATMKVSEEVDALRTMGISPSRFLVLPRVLAMLVVQPALTLMSDVIGIFGGFLIGVMYLDLSPSSYVNQTLASVGLGDVMSGLGKSVIFAAIIVTIACYSGLNVEGGASGVGRATTRAVVSSIFMIIVADSIFALLTTLL